MRFFTLASRYLDQVASEEEVAELAEILRKSATRQLQMAGLLEQHANLTRLAAVLIPRPEERPPLKFEPRARDPRGPALALVAAVLLGLLALSVGLSERPDQTAAGGSPSASARVRASSSPAATIGLQPTPTKAAPAPSASPPIEATPKTASPTPAPAPRRTPLATDPTPISTPPAPTPSPAPSLTPAPTPVVPVQTPPTPTAPALCRVLRTSGRALRRGEPLTPGDSIRAGEELATEAGASLTLESLEGTQLQIGGGAQLSLTREAGTQLDLHQGKVALVVKKTSRKAPWRVVTPHAHATVVGTTFEVEVRADRTRVEVFEGRVSVRRVAQRRALTLRKGRYVLISPGKRALRALKRKRPRPQPKGQVVLREDFQAMTPGEWPRDWKRPRKAEAALLEVAREGQNLYLRSTAPDGKKAQKGSLPISKLTPPFSVEVRFRLTGQRSERVGFNLWNGVDERRYGVDYSASRRRLTVFNTSHDEDLLDEAPQQVEARTWHTLRARFAGKKIFVGLDDAEPLSVELSATPRIEELWLVSLGRDPAHFDEVVIRRP